MLHFNLSRVASALSSLAVVATSAIAGQVTLDFHLATPNGNPVTDLFVYSTAPGEAPSLYSVPGQLLPTGIQSLTYEARAIQKRMTR